MNSLVLLFGVGILGAVLCGATDADEATVDPLYEAGEDPQDKSSPDSSSAFPDLDSPTNSSTDSLGFNGTTPPQDVSHRTPAPSSGPNPDTDEGLSSHHTFYKKECLHVFMVSGGLIIACTALLISTLLLACRVCQLSRHVKALNSDSELISNSGYWMGTARQNKSTTKAEAKETGLLMAEVSQTQEEMGNGAPTKEDGGKDGQTEEETNDKEKKKKEEEEEEVAAANGEEAPTTAAPVEENSSSKSQEEASVSKPSDAAEASTNVSTKEPKDAV